MKIQVEFLYLFKTAAASSAAIILTHVHFLAEEERKRRTKQESRESIEQGVRGARRCRPRNLGCGSTQPPTNPMRGPSLSRMDADEKRGEFS